MDDRQPDDWHPHDWPPRGSVTALRQRAHTLTVAREFFAAREVLEVETPVLCRYPTTDVFIESLSVMQTGHWLRTSPEHHMKRLLAHGAPDIYQIGKVFRAGERGTRHEPEFTMAEWYRLGFDLDAMIDETCAFIGALTESVGYVVGATQIHDYNLLFSAVTGHSADAPVSTLTAIAATAPGYSGELAAQLGEDRSAWLDFIASHLLYPSLPDSGLQVVRDFPAEQAMLARLRPDNPAVAERFEVFCNGLELANGFRELADAGEQRERFTRDNTRRQQAGRPVMPVDELLLGALDAGLPDCSGVAVGIDRVLLVAGGHKAIAETLSFRSGY